MASVAKRLKPLMDRVLIRRMKPAEKTASGIIIPEEARKVINEGEVLAVGPGTVTKDGAKVPVSVAVGDRVLLPEYGGTSFTLEKEELHVFRDVELIAKILPA